jgi:hypothetical protein
MQLISTEKTDYFHTGTIPLNKPKGITSGYRSYTHGEGESRATIIITNDTIDALLVIQLSDNGTVLLEIQGYS